MEKISHWQLEISDRSNKRYGSTIIVHILAPEMLDAVTRATEKYPDSRIISCVHKGTFEGDLYVKPTKDNRTGE